MQIILMLLHQILMVLFQSHHNIVFSQLPLGLKLPIVSLDSQEDANLSSNFTLRQISLPGNQAGLTNAQIIMEQNAESSRSVELRPQAFHFNLIVFA